MSDDTQLPDWVDESEREAYEAYLAYGYDEDEDSFREAFAGEYTDRGDYAEELTRECYEIPSYLDYYVNWESMEHDWELSGDITTERLNSGTYLVFRNI